MSANEVDVENSAATSEAHLEKIETQPDHEHHSIPHELLKTKSTHPLEQVETHRAYSGWRWLTVCIALYVSALLYGIDTTVTADIQSAAIETFGDVTQLGWLGIGFPLGSIASILPVGKAFGIFDVKWVYIISVVLFEVGSALCGGAPNMNALIVGRVIAGVGGAGLYLGVLNILSLNTTIKQRPLYIAGCATVWGVGCIIGPVIGGSFADSAATWRWAFYINLVIFGLSAPIFFFMLESYNPQKGVPLREKAAHIDWLGVVLNAGMYLFFVMPFTFAGALWAWSDPRVITFIVLFAVFFLAFAVQQTFSILTTPERRLFPIDFLRDRDLVVQYIAMSTGAGATFVAIYYIPLYFTFAKGDTSIDAAVRLLPFMVLTIISSLFNGAMMPRWGYYMPWFLLSGIFLVIGGSLMYALVDENTPNSKIYGFTVLLGLGSGLAQQAAYSVAQAKVPMNRIADAVGFINSSQIGAIVIALTVSGAVFQNLGFQHISDVLAGTDFTPEDIHNALAGTKSAIFTEVTPAVREQVIGAIVSAMNNAYILVIAAGAVSIVSSLFMKREKIFMEMSGGG